MTSLAERLARPEILALPPFDISANANALFARDAVKLDANENPYPPLGADALSTDVNRYPEPQPAHLVAAMAALPWRGRLVQLGSVHEYGLVRIGTSIAEDTEANPSMAYGKLKVEATEVILRAARDGLVDGLVLRLGNVVGAGQPHHSLLGVIAGKLSTAAREGRPAALTLAPLAAKRDFFDLDDAADAVLAAVRSEASGRVVNIGSGSASSAREVVELLIKVSGVPTEIENTTGNNGETDDLEWQQLSVGLASDVLGWMPRRDLSDAVESLWTALAVDGANLP